MTRRRDPPTGPIGATACRRLTIPWPIRATVHSLRAGRRAAGVAALVAVAPVGAGATAAAAEAEAGRPGAAIATGTATGTATAIARVRPSPAVPQRTETPLRRRARPASARRPAGANARAAGIEAAQTALALGPSPVVRAGVSAVAGRRHGQRSPSHRPRSLRHRSTSSRAWARPRSRRARLPRTGAAPYASVP